MGFIVIPYMWLFQFIFQLFVPFADLYSLFALLTGGSIKILYFYLAFFLVDFFTCWFAFGLEKESRKPLWGFLYQRFVYRYLLCYIVYRAFLNALSGKRLGWNKLQRKGSVKLPLKG
ncbi:hypothetical protein [Ammoniphilus resinae]|uniref:Uncharacterized protein n=1 Tax=Ammoniphilus resinae TaxID=861532 RepID=A0ABS4GQW3_9BACL|nr:hypothetical protein [Ammoniphilus resinae]MBP1932626.1 hypothetical protein [Ammoniphilus resinae]